MDSNRVRLALVRESTLGVSPTMRMRTMRITKEALKYTPKFFTPAEIRADRMSSDPTKINEENTGTVDFEISWPKDGTWLSELYQSACLSLWTNAPFRDNDTAGSITAVTTSTNVVSVAAGSSFFGNALVRHTGFTNAANNGTFRVTTPGASSYTCSAASFVTETPPSTARTKVVGVWAASGDVTATATGLGSTALNWLLTGIVVGQWVKVGGTGTANRFATAANNDWVRVTAIAATALTFDNLPAAWATDTGVGKTIAVFFGDVIRNGTTLVGLEIEKGFLDQAAPTYILQRGMVVDQLSHSLATEAQITGTATFIGMAGAQGTVANGTQYDPAPAKSVLTANVSVGRIAEAGSTVMSPNWAKSLMFTFANNIRMITAVGNVGAVSLGVGEIGVTGTIETYFGSNALFTKLMAGTPSALSARSSAPDPVTGDNQALVWTFPRVTFTDGSPNAGGKNQDVTLPLSFVTSMDALTACELDIQRLEYFEV